MAQTDASRRRILRNGAVLAAGLFGFDGARHLASAGPSTPAALVLRTSDVRLLGSGSPGLDVRRTGMGDLDGGGHLYVTQTLTDSAITDGTIERMEQHLFVLADGQIVGVGSVGRDGVGSFAVTGGTGRFDGASGSYTTTYEDDPVDGVGAASFTFQLTTASVRNGGT